MKAAIVYGDMLSDKTDEQYPQIAYCDECFADIEKAGEDSGIVHEVPYDAELHGKCCERCECEES